MKLIFDCYKKTIFNADHLISVEIDDIDNHLCFNFTDELFHTKSYSSYDECECVLNDLCDFLIDNSSVSYIIPKPTENFKKE